MKNRPVHARLGRVRIAYAASATMRGSREVRIASSPPSKFRTAAVAIVVRGHRELAATPYVLNSSAKPSVHMLMPYFAMLYARLRPNQIGLRFKGGDRVSTWGLAARFRWGKHARVKAGSVGKGCLLRHDTG